MKLLKIPRRIHEQYQYTVAGNKDIPLVQLQKAMTRNMLLSEISRKHTGEGVYYMYGSLHFIVDNGAVIWMRNRQEMPVSWKKNEDMYLRLNERLKINA